MALSLAKVEEVREMLAAGLSQREIAREAGVSRQTVAKIVHGRWSPPLRARIEGHDAGDNPGVHVTPAQSKRIIARARAAAQRKTPESIRELFARHGPPELDLRPDDQASYISVRRQIQAEGQMAADDAYDPRDAA